MTTFQRGDRILVGTELDRILRITQVFDDGDMYAVTPSGVTELLVSGVSIQHAPFSRADTALLALAERERADRRGWGDSGYDADALQCSSVGLVIACHEGWAREIVNKRRTTGQRLAMSRYRITPRGVVRARRLHQILAEQA